MVYVTLVVLGAVAIVAGSLGVWIKNSPKLKFDSPNFWNRLCIIGC